jgi:hypothetical protein
MNIRPKFKDLMNCKFTQEGDLDLSKSWWSYTALGKKYVRFYELLDDDSILDALEEKFGEEGFWLEAYLIFDYDKDTNCDSCEVDEYFADELIDAMKAIAPEVEITDRLEKIAYDTDGYKFTELD